MREIFILDLEGTITDHTHRLEYYQKKDYDSYNKLFNKDKLNVCFMDGFWGMYSKMNRKVDIIIVSAKSEKYRKDVEQWLANHFVSSSALIKLSSIVSHVFMRKEGDERSAVDVKMEIVTVLLTTNTVYTAYDDRADICRMYANIGIPTVLVKCALPEHSHRQKTPADYLRASADIFESRNEEYGDGYMNFGNIILAFFPDGITLSTAKDFSRFGALVMATSKLDRYCKNFCRNGHEDSLADLSVYSAMIRTIDKLSERKDN